MRSIESRLARVARDIQHRAAGCPVCGGAGEPVVRVHFEHQPMRPAEPCPRCGRTPGVVEVVFVDGDEETPRPAAA